MTQPPQNPYDNGVIEKPDHFFNREMLTQKLLNSLFSGSVRCLSLVGERKSGKTSLVKHLSDPTVIKASGYKSDHHLFVYILCGQDRKALRDPDDFYRLLLNELLAEVSNSLPELANKTNANLAHHVYSWQQEWNKLLRELTKVYNFSIVVILDGFEALLNEFLIEEKLFGGLHACATANFAWIVCTLRPLPLLFKDAFKKFEISEDRIQSESDFYNLFPTSYPVALFEQKDIEKLLTLPQDLTFSEQERATILRFGGHFPYFVQQACSRFLEAHRQGKVDHRAILQECVKGATAIWSGYWNRLNPQQQRLLYTIANNHPVKPSTEIEELKDASLVYEENGSFHPFSEEFQAFILSREHSPIGFPVKRGDRLWDQFEVEEILGRTYHSQVVKARDILLPEEYFAIKLPYVNTNLDDQQIQQLQELMPREVRIIRSLNHDNIGKIRDVRLNPLGIIMPWIEGQSLDIVMESRRPFPPDLVASIGMQLADALRCVHEHEHGIIHRDIKPKNIMLAPKDKPVLIDFDVAHSANEHTLLTVTTDTSPSYVGNKEYRSPEQFMPPYRVTQAADLFALGLILHELATEPGQRAFPYGSDPAAYPRRRLPKPNQYAIPDPLYKVLCSLLRQKPEERSSARKAYDALKKISPC